MHPIQSNTTPPLSLVVCHGHFHAKVCPQENPGNSSIAAVSDIAKHVSDTHLFPMTIIKSRPIATNKPGGTNIRERTKYDQSRKLVLCTCRKLQNVAEWESVVFREGKKGACPDGPW